MKWITILLTLTFPLVQAAEPVVRLAAIQAVFDDGAEDFDGFKTLNANKGYQAVLIIHGGGRQIVAVNDETATVKIGGVDARCRFFAGSSNMSKDMQSIRVEFSAEGECKLTEGGALHMSGEIPLTFATGKEETRSEAFTLEEGVEVKFPAEKAADLPELKVKSAGKPKFGDGLMEIEFTTNRKIDDFAGVIFYDKDGKIIEAQRSGSSWMSFNNQGSGEVSYIFKSKPTELILAVENWSGREEVPVKFDLVAGLAGPKS